MNAPSTIARDNADQFEARLVGYSKQARKDGNWVEVRLHIHPDDVTEALALAPLGTSFAVVAVPFEAVENTTKNTVKAPTATKAENTDDLSTKPKGGRLAKQAGIACGDKRFWAFLLEEENGTACIFDAEDAARHVKRICGISSRAQLDHDEIAAAKWRDLHEAYQAWLVQ